MTFTVLIPARLASTRLPNKPLADLAGVPMVVRVAQQALRSGAQEVIVAGDDAEIVTACQAHGIQAVLTGSHHPSGSDRLAEACELLGLPDDAIVVNVQGDEPLMDPQLVTDVAHLLARRPQAAMSTAAHALDSVADFHNPNVVKVVLDAQHMALYFSRAPIAYPARYARPVAQPGAAAPHRHLRATGSVFCACSPSWPRRRWSAPSRLSNCARCGTAIALRCTSPSMRPDPAWTPPKTWSGYAVCWMHKACSGIGCKPCKSSRVLFSSLT